MFKFLFSTLIVIIMLTTLTDWLISLSVFCSARAQRSLSNPISLRICNVRGFTHFEFLVLTNEFLALLCSRPNCLACFSFLRRSVTNAIASLILLAQARRPVRASVLVNPKYYNNWLSLQLVWNVRFENNKSNLPISTKESTNPSFICSCCHSRSAVDRSSKAKFRWFLWKFKIACNKCMRIISARSFAALPFNVITRFKFSP